jgi:hypothetical protein
MTSAEIVIEFIKGRPELEAEVRKLADQPYRAPEIMACDVANHVIATMAAYVTKDERKKLSRMEGNGQVSWRDVTKAFMVDATAPTEPPSVDPLSDKTRFASIRLDRLSLLQIALDDIEQHAAHRGGAWAAMRALEARMKYRETKS